MGGPRPGPGVGEGVEEGEGDGDGVASMPASVLRQTTARAVFVIVSYVPLGQSWGLAAAEKKPIAR